MDQKCYCHFRFVIFLLILIKIVQPIIASTSNPEVTIEQLADICKELESSILDISLEYEWYVDTTMTLEEKLQFITDKNWSIIEGPQRCKMVCSLVPPDLNNPDTPIFDNFLFEESLTTMREPNKLSNEMIKSSFDGEISKYLSIKGAPIFSSQGSISKLIRDPFDYPNPLKQFSILRFSISGVSVTGNKPLSEMLRHNEYVYFDNTVKEINGFNTVRVDLLQKPTKMPYMCIYFSLDHRYTPVRFEHLNGPGGTAVLSIEVTSLQEVGEDIWFPSSGVIIDHNSKHAEVNRYKATAPILVNQGLSKKDFDIEFPVGTKVHDKIQDKEYVTK